MASRFTQGVVVASLVNLLAATNVLADKGPNGGQLVDVAERFHLELLVTGQELRLFVSDLKDQPVAVAGGTAKASVIAVGGKASVELKPAAANMLSGSGSFGRSKSMKVDVLLSLPGSPPITAKFTPLADAPGGGHAGHKH